MQRPESQGFRRAFGGGGGGGRRFDGPRRDRFEGPAGPPVDYKGLVEFVARSLAESPEQVEIISQQRGPGTVALKVKMADADMGRLIGRGGRNIEALRTIVRVASLRERKRVFVDMFVPR